MTLLRGEAEVRSGEVVAGAGDPGDVAALGVVDPAGALVDVGDPGRALAGGKGLPGQIRVASHVARRVGEQGVLRAHPELGAIEGARGEGVAGFADRLCAGELGGDAP